MTNKVDYQSNRPFLIVDIYYVPARGAKTHMKGWGDAKGAWEAKENPYVVDRLTDKHRVRASVIIDLLKRKMIKSRYDQLHDDEVINHFITKYTDEINHSINIWRAKNGAAAEAVLVNSDTSQHADVTVTMA